MATSFERWERSFQSNEVAHCHCSTALLSKRGSPFRSSLSKHYSLAASSWAFHQQPSSRNGFAHLSTPSFSVLYLVGKYFTILSCQTRRHRSPCWNRYLGSTVIAFRSLTLQLVDDHSLYTVFSGILDKLWVLWELVLLGEPIVIMANSPDICSSAVLNLISLIRPVLQLLFCTYWEAKLHGRLSALLYYTWPWIPSLLWDV